MVVPNGIFTYSDWVHVNQFPGTHLHLILIKFLNLCNFQIFQSCIKNEN